MKKMRPEFDFSCLDWLACNVPDYKTAVYLEKHIGLHRKVVGKTERTPIYSLDRVHEVLIVKKKLTRDVKRVCKLKIRENSYIGRIFCPAAEDAYAEENMEYTSGKTVVCVIIRKCVLVNFNRKYTKDEMCRVLQNESVVEKEATQEEVAAYKERWDKMGSKATQSTHIQRKPNVALNNFCLEFTTIEFVVKKTMTKCRDSVYLTGKNHWKDIAHISQEKKASGVVSAIYHGDSVLDAKIISQEGDTAYAVVSVSRLLACARNKEEVIRFLKA